MAPQKRCQCHIRAMWTNGAWHTHAEPPSTESRLGHSGSPPIICAGIHARQEPLLGCLLVLLLRQGQMGTGKSDTLLAWLAC